MNDQQVLRALQTARALISDPRRWTTFVMARDVDGAACSPHRAGAVRFCAIGAVEHVSVGRPWDADQVLALLHTYAEAKCIVFSGAGLAFINDYDGHLAVLAVFDGAIAQMEGRIGKPELEVVGV